MLVLICAPSFLIGWVQAGNASDPWAVEATYLRNFTHYVSWPEHTFDSDQSPWRICILGDDPFGGKLENTFAERTEKGRSFSIHRIDDTSELHQCQIAYIAHERATNRRAALAEIEDLPVLTVSNAPDFLDEGGIIRFDISSEVEMNINLDQARRVALKIETKMLEVSQDVLENGKVHKMKK